MLKEPSRAVDPSFFERWGTYRPELPVDIKWPIRNDRESAIRYLDALISGDIDFLEKIQQRFIGMPFQHSSYVDDLKLIASRSTAAAPLLEPEEQEPPLVPETAKETIRQRLSACDFEGMRVTLDCAAWDNGQSTFEFAFTYQGQVLTRVAANELGDYRILEHHAASYKLLGINPGAYRRYLKLTRKATVSTRSRQGNMDESCPTPLPESEPPTLSSAPSEPLLAKSAPSSGSDSATGGSPCPPPTSSTSRSVNVRRSTK